MEQNEKVTLQKLKKELEELRAQYESVLARGVQESEKKPSPALSQMKAFLEQQEKWLNEYVEIRLFKDNDRYKDDVYVSINGHNCVIKRGIWTRIRRKYALLLEQSEIQDLRTAERIAQESKQFAAESRLRGL